MSNRARQTLLAEADLGEIWKYIAAGDPTAADTWLASILEKCRNLAEFPSLGRARDDLPRGMRSFPFGQYLIIYRSTKDGILVVRVLHGMRDLPRQFPEE